MHTLLSVLMGGIGGLISVLACSVLASLPQARPPSPLTVGEIILHWLAGTVLGLLFWLSWGLAGLVNVSWWQRGVIFALLGWLALALPAVLSLHLSQPARSGAVATTAWVSLRWGMTCLLSSLVCAWQWRFMF